MLCKDVDKLASPSIHFRPTVMVWSGLKYGQEEYTNTYNKKKINGKTGNEHHVLFQLKQTH